MHRMTPTVSPQRAEMRKQVLTLLVSVVVLDAIMVGAYYGFHVRDRLQKTQMTFVAVWIVLTLIVVTTIMKRIRKLRRRR
jgi:F0F1-type ATP synthase assembly protein I